MKKELKDYLHLYLGCECKDNTNKGGYALDGELIDYFKNSNEPVDFKPILRPLSDMTEDEMKELWKLVFEREFGKNGRIIFFEAERSTPTRWVLMSGVERLGIENDGNIWADSDLHNYRFNRHEITLWLLSKRFDLFGLIESGLAIDKTKIKTQNEQHPIN